MKFTSYIIMTIFVSFLGFLVENIWLSFTKGYIDNRNMTLPFLLGYGLFIIGFYLIFKTPDTFLMHSTFFKIKHPLLKKIIYFINAFLLVSIGEIILGFITEKYFGFYYWNYENIPLSITRYTSIPTSLGFSTIIYIFMQDFFLPILEFIFKINNHFLSFISIVFLFLLIIDLKKSFGKMHTTHHLNQKWRIYINQKNKLENKTIS